MVVISQCNNLIVVQIFGQFKSTGMNRGKMSSILASELPDKTPLEISLHEDWYTKYKAYLRKNKEIITSHNIDERNALLMKGMQFVQL